MILAKPENMEAFTAKGWWGTSTVDDLSCQRLSAFGNTEVVIDPVNRSAIFGDMPSRLLWTALADALARLAGVLVGPGLRKDARCNCCAQAAIETTRTHRRVS